MTSIDKDIADQILRANGLRAAGLGLRFDRVAQSVLGELRAFVEDAAALEVSVLMTLTAPIRLPALTVGELKREIGGRLATPVAGEDHMLTVQGNAVRLRLLADCPGPAFVGFVHNPSSPSARLLDLAEQWARGR